MNSLQQLVHALRVLPGIGQKSSEKMALHLLERDREGAKVLVDSLNDALNNLKHCSMCRVLTQKQCCEICEDIERDESKLCIVQSPSDLQFMENSGLFEGRYYVLYGHLSPIDGIGPQQLGLDKLAEFIHSLPIEEVIIATHPTIEGDATANYIAHLLSESQVVVTRLAQGLPLGKSLDQADAGTLSRALQARHIVK
ncbi:MAG: recombination protein RecR [Saccharospirillaceae bacterium]|nr:recombination mediator RecR [Pseudomonadales bacterium]NRB78652.1 recombination protein RecR [Saccharospirillaceae bacterium]